MNIVAIAGSTIPSDTANSIQVMKACQALVQAGQAVTLIVPGQAPETEAGLKSLYGLEVSFPINWLPVSNRRLFAWQAVRHAARLCPDLLYVWMPQSTVFGLLQELPVIFEAHIQPSGFFGPLWHRGFALLPGQKRLVCITQALAKVLEHDFGMHMRAGETVIAPNGVELERFASLPNPETARRQIDFPATPTVICTGHLYAGRGVDLFLALAKAIPSVQFAWVGGRPEDVSAWETCVQEQGLHNVTFVGFVPNRSLPLYQAAADVLLMPYARTIYGSSGSADSAMVASPMKMFEYMAAGRAILTSDLPVIREVLNENNAVFCEPGNVDAWATALHDLLADKKKRTALSNQARQDVEKFTWLARAKRILAGFEG